MKKYLLALLIILSTQGFAAHSLKKTNERAKFRYTLEFLLHKVLEKKRLEFNPLIPMPELKLGGETPLNIFQDAIETQWGFRPEKFSNAFSVKSNTIFILDEANYYQRNNRCMDDSLVHELVHYVQVKYLNWDLNDDSLEWDAIDVQTEFRNEYCQR